jgi:hypothetical protein
VKKRPATPSQTTSLRLVLSVCVGVTGLFAAVGCGAGSEVEEGATVVVYSGTTLCAEAKTELGEAGREGDAVRVTVICTKPVERNGKLDLAIVGANARRAVEDSRSVAYLEAPGRSTRFIRPILEEPEIALVVDSSGAHGMTRTLDTLRSRGDSESPRESVWEGR